MPNLCLIGNSHIAAMLYAWKEMLPLQENVRADFFAQHANTRLWQAERRLNGLWQQHQGHEADWGRTSTLAATP